jgi:hypothetical protein
MVDLGRLGRCDVIPTSEVPVSWLGSLMWLAGLALVSFLVTWIFTDKIRMRRTPYIGLLTAVTVVIGWGYVRWAGLGLADVLLNRWALGLLVAPIVGAFLTVGIRRLPVGQPLHGRRLVVAILWEGGVYGIAEGLLLSTLPVLMTWQMVDALGWSGLGGAVGRWTLPTLASVAVIVVHHLGYWEYRNGLLRPIAAGCGLMSIGYLITGSPIAPVVAHIIAHVSGLQHGGELPPHEHGAPPESYELRVADSMEHVAGRR